MNRRTGCLIAIIVPAVFWAAIITAAWWWPFMPIGDGPWEENSPWP